MILQNGKALLTLPALPESFPVLRDFLEKMLEELAAGVRPGQQVLIAADEIFTNITSYAYPEKNGEVSIHAEYMPETGNLDLVFQDSGIPFDPLQQRDPDVNLPPEQRQIGGVGILVVKKMMDEVSYRYADGYNLLTIRKKIKGETK